MTHPARSLSLIAALALATALAGCGKDQAAASNRGKDGGNAPVIVTTTVLKPSTFADSIVAIGTARAADSITVTAKVSEIVQAVHFDSGDEVAKGAVLVTLSGQQQQAALAQAEAAAKESQQLYARQQELARQQLIATSQLDTQRATRDQALAQVNQVRAQLSDRSIRAPFGGVLGIRQVSPGALVTPGTAIATLDDLSHMYVDFPVPEAALAQLATGQQVFGRTAAYPDKRLTGTVTTVEARVDPATRSVTVRADFPNADRALRPGMLVNVELQRAQRTALLVPEIAVVQVGNRTFVYRAKTDGSVEQVDVQVGTRTGGQAEIVKGIGAGDRIVVDGTGKLRPGAKIVEPDVAPTTAKG
ncbi:RND family efflux transporter MFP subunit [Lysobacter dokdonensis DS-58]|uniref:RND family efflux transporter MFP subunit n=1 Tax=Lysobacter dokdonensis DS-58 TaxID=1300345 RepID=A0A0A2WF87_9GAMM|nr:efflux RND transporter periplasmic adaptor subunit [Lysobacter dokdonensis]KGQ18418.1 RND family efflux transporter MFP subunit [Lysobacter dokdonensis DS-58]